MVRFRAFLSNDDTDVYLYESNPWILLEQIKKKMDAERFDNLYFYIEILNKFSDDIVEGYKFDLKQIYNGVESGRRYR